VDLVVEPMVMALLAMLIQAAVAVQDLAEAAATAVQVQLTKVMPVETSHLMAQAATAAALAQAAVVEQPEQTALAILALVEMVPKGTL
jgi:6-phosphofructokinase